MSINTKDLANRAGVWLHDKLDLDNPMGSWTGLPFAIGAPLSGALYGAGLGGALYFKRRLIDKKRKRRDWWKWPLVAGGLGAGVGLLSSKLAAAPDLSMVERAIVADRALDPWEKQELLGRLRHAPDDTIRKLAMMASAGTLTGILAAMLLGPPSGLLAGALGAAISANNYRRTPYYV